MTRSGPGAGRSPVAITALGSSRSARRPGTPGRGGKVVAGLVALGLARHLLRSRRFQEGVAVTTIAVEALRGISKENRESAMARLSDWNKRQAQRLELETEREALRLAAWNERQVQRLEREAKRQARAVKRTAQQRS